MSRNGNRNIINFCSPSSNFQDKKHNIRDELFSGKNSIFKATGIIKIFKYWLFHLTNSNNKCMVVIITVVQTIEISSKGMVWGKGGLRNFWGNLGCVWPKIGSRRWGSEISDEVDIVVFGVLTIIQTRSGTNSTKPYT